MNILAEMPNKQGRSGHKTAIDRDKRTKRRIDKQTNRKLEKRGMTGKKDP